MNYQIHFSLFQNLYDRVAGDDIDTGDEIEAFDKSNKEDNSINIYYEHPQHKRTLRVIADDNNQDALHTHEIYNSKTKNLLVEEASVHKTKIDHRTNSYSPNDEVEEEKVVMRITPRPPIRKRPKSTPVLDHVSNQLSQMMEDKMRYSINIIEKII